MPYRCFNTCRKNLLFKFHLISYWKVFLYTLHIICEHEWKVKTFSFVSFHEQMWIYQITIIRALGQETGLPVWICSSCSTSTFAFSISSIMFSLDLNIAEVGSDSRHPPPVSLIFITGKELPLQVKGKMPST